MNNTMNIYRRTTQKSCL